MKGFLTVFSLECKKVFSSKGFWIFAIVILVLCLIVTASFKSIDDLLEGMDDSVVEGGAGATAAEMARYYELQLEEYRKAVESGATEQKLSDTTETQLKNMIAIYTYCDEHGIDPDKLTTLGTSTMLRMSSSDYVTTMTQLVFAFVTIMSIVLAAKTFAGEREDGTMRMQLTRPIKRSTLLTAKHAAVFVSSMATGLALTVIFMVVGATFFDASTSRVVLVDAYQNVTIINPYAAILLLLAIYAVTVEVVVQFTLFVGTFVTKTGALAIPLVLYLFAGSVAMLLYSTRLPFVGLFTNLSWASALTPAGAPIRGMSIYSMIAVTLVWTAAMTTTNYLMFEKRDLKLKERGLSLSRRLSSSVLRRRWRLVLRATDCGKYAV